MDEKEAVEAAVETAWAAVEAAVEARAMVTAELINTRIVVRKRDM